MVLEPLEDVEQLLVDRREVPRHRVEIGGGTAAPERDGAIGKLLEVRARGKEDKRAGGEDLMVLGTHCFDMMRFLIGDPEWVFAHVTDQGHEVGRGSGRRATEPVGTIAGDDISAMFAFAGGVSGYFGSKANDVTSGSRFGVTFYGSHGAIWMPLGNVPCTPNAITRYCSAAERSSQFDALRGEPANRGRMKLLASYESEPSGHFAWQLTHAPGPGCGNSIL